MGLGVGVCVWVLVEHDAIMFLKYYNQFVKMFLFFLYEKFNAWTASHRPLHLQGDQCLCTAGARSPSFSMARVPWSVWTGFLSSEAVLPGTGRPLTEEKNGNTWKK